MRRSPGHHASLLGPAEQFFDIPLTTEPVHNPARAPEVSIRAQHPPSEPGILQLATQRRIHMPAQGWPLVASVDLSHHKPQKFFGGRLFFFSCPRPPARDVLGLPQSSQFPYLPFAFANPPRHAAFLARQ